MKLSSVFNSQQKTPTYAKECTEVFEKVKKAKNEQRPILVFVHPRYMEHLRQIFENTKHYTQLEKNVGGKVFFLSRVYSVNKYKARFSERARTNKFTQTNVNKVIARDLLFPANIAGQRRLYNPGTASKAKDIYIISPKSKDFMYNRIQLINSMMKTFTGNNSEIMIGNA